MKLIPALSESIFDIGHILGTGKEAEALADLHKYSLGFINELLRQHRTIQSARLA